jgi:hypothetical protein
MPLSIAADVAVAAPAAPAPPTAGDEENARDAVYFEVLGNGILYSVNYERFLPRYNLGLRGGASFITYKVSSASGSGNLTFATWPLVVSYYWGLPRHKLQLGLGATILYFDASSDSTGTKIEGAGTGFGVAATAVIGYRYMPKNGGFTFGAGFTPLLRDPKGFLAWGGANAGFAF